MLEIEQTISMKRILRYFYKEILSFGQLFVDEKKNKKINNFRSTMKSIFLSLRFNIYVCISKRPNNISTPIRL